MIDSRLDQYIDRAKVLYFFFHKEKVLDFLNFFFWLVCENQGGKVVCEHIIEQTNG